MTPCCARVVSAGRGFARTRTSSELAGTVCDLAISSSLADGPAVPVDLVELTELLRSSRNRVLHLLGAVASVMALITVVAAVRVATTPDVDSWNLVMWGVGCGVFALFATLWYRARVKAIEQLVEAVRGGSSLYRCQVTKVLVKRIPAGYEVDLIAVDAARQSAARLAFGFWTLALADKLVALLQPHMVAGPPPAFPIKMRSPVRR